MIVGVPKEIFPGENRVALIPDILPILKKSGFDVQIETNAGLAAGFTDKAYTDKGGTICASRAELFAKSNIILQVRSLGANKDVGASDLKLFQKGQIVIGFAEPLSEPESIKLMAEAGVTSFSMELMPRITRAQSMDALSSMATTAGYKAVLLAASTLPRMFPMNMTAAGTLTPAKVLVIGAGVAGLQAIATAKRLGAVVKGYDIRPAVKEQVESLGAKFVEVEIDSGTSEDKGGYAKEMGEEFYRKQRELMTSVVGESHVVITTAAVPGRKAPVLVTKEMVAGMAPGSVIVDLAAERGGNCELTKPGEVIVVNNVTIIGYENLPSTVPFHASQMYSKNIATFLKHLAPEGKFTLNLEDEITRETVLTHQGKVVHAKVAELLGISAIEAGGKSDGN